MNANVLYGVCLFLLGIIIIYGSFTYGNVIIPCPENVQFWEIDKLLKAGICAIVQVIFKGFCFIAGLYVMFKGVTSL